MAGKVTIIDIEIPDPVSRSELCLTDGRRKHSDAKCHFVSSMTKSHISREWRIKMDEQTDSACQAQEA